MTAQAQRIRVMWVMSPLMARGGGFDILRGWIRNLPVEEFDISLAFYAHDPSTVRSALAEFPNLRLHHLDALHSPRAAFVPAVVALRRLMLTERPHIVHSVMVQGDIVGGLAARLTGVPVIMSSVIGCLVAHTSPIKGRLYRAGIGLVRRRMDMVLAISGATKRELVEEFHYDEQRVKVVYSGIDLAPVARGAESGQREAPVIGTVGELIEEKGAQFLLQAAPAILKRFPSTRFRLVGEGDYRQHLEQLARDLGIAESVEFAGWQPSGRDAIADLDVFVFPSKPGYDGLPRVTLEAWLTGTPHVTSNVAVVPEIVTHGVDAILVPPCDPAAIADGVIQLLSDANLRRRIAEAGRQRVQDFSVEREVETLRLVYSELLHKAADRMKAS